jgi:hypothetical protein
LDVIANEIRETTEIQLMKNDSFYQRQPVMATDGMLYCIGYESMAVHVFTGLEWRLVHKDNLAWTK